VSGTSLSLDVSSLPHTSRSTILYILLYLINVIHLSWQYLSNCKGIN